MSRGFEYFMTADNSCKLMLFLVNDILDYSQLESKSILLNYNRVDIKDIVKEVITILKFKSDSKGLKLFLNIKPETKLLMETDENRLR